MNIDLVNSLRDQVYLSILGSQTHHRPIPDMYSNFSLSLSFHIFFTSASFNIGDPTVGVRGSNWVHYPTGNLIR